MLNKIVLFGAGHEGINTLNFIDPDTVDFFVDNDYQKWGSTIAGIPVYSPEILRGTDRKVYVAAIGSNQKQIIKQLFYMGICAEPVHSLVKGTNIRNDKRIMSLKNKFEGKRCFIIGTGPSLKIEDLERVYRNGDVSFASNRIFKLFHKTQWRPQLYCVSDLELFSFYYSTICEMNIENMFLVNIGEVNTKAK